MLNIHDLEKRWKIYKLKSLLPYFIIGISLIIIIPLIYIFYTHKNINTIPQKKIVKEKNTSVVAVVTTLKKPKEKPMVKKTEPLKKTISTQTLKPSMNFMQNIQHEASQPQYIKKVRKTVKTKKIREVVQDVTPQITPVKKEPKVDITIERKETQNDIFEIIKRFKKNNNPALSLFVAKKYYELGKYEQAYNYALITNQINSNIEASWIVFAKALVKLHKKNKAIYTLQEYIKVSHSSNAEILLNEIKSGKFR